MSLANLKESFKHSCKQMYALCPELAQNAILSGYSYLRRGQKYGPRFRENFSSLMQSQWWPYAELRCLQTEKLRALVTHAYDSVPYYRKVFDRSGVRPGDIRGPEDLARLPLLTKQDIIANFDDLISTQYPRVRGHLIGTSGTTGTPLQFYWDSRREAMETALIQRSFNWAGFRRGDALAVFRGIEINVRGGGPARYWRFNRAENELCFSSSHMSEETLPYYVEQLERFKPVAVWGYPSSVYVLAQYLADRNIRPDVALKGIFLSSEPLYPWHRSVIESALGARITDRYGLSEGVISACQCERHERYHIDMEVGVMEVIPSPEIPGVNEIVATGLDNYMMPFIRYCTGDVVESVGGECGCGRGLPLMGGVQTKAEDSVVTPDGRTISPSVLTFPFKALNGIVKSQIVQLSKEDVVIKLVVNDVYVKSAEAALVSGMKQRLGETVSIRIEYVSDIPRTASGKYRWVVSNIAPTVAARRATQ